VLNICQKQHKRIESNSIFYILCTRETNQRYSTKSDRDHQNIDVLTAIYAKDDIFGASFCLLKYCREKSCLGIVDFYLLIIDLTAGFCINSTYFTAANIIKENLKNNFYTRNCNSIH